MNILEAVELAMQARADGFTVDSVALRSQGDDTWYVRIRLEGESSRDVYNQEAYRVFTEAMRCPHTTILLTTCTDSPQEAVAMCRDCGAEYGTGEPGDIHAQQERWQLNSYLFQIRSGMRQRQLPR